MASDPTATKANKMPKVTVRTVMAIKGQSCHHPWQQSSQDSQQEPSLGERLARIAAAQQAPLQMQNQRCQRG